MAYGSCVASVRDKNIYNLRKEKKNDEIFYVIACRVVFAVISLWIWYCAHLLSKQVKILRRRGRVC